MLNFCYDWNKIYTKDKLLTEGYNLVPKLFLIPDL